jgi:hypothetical protein
MVYNLTGKTSNKELLHKRLTKFHSSHKLLVLGALINAIFSSSNVSCSLCDTYFSISVKVRGLSSISLILKITIYLLLLNSETVHCTLTLYRCPLFLNSTLIAN